MKKRIALLCPNSWDHVQLERSRARWEDAYEIVPYGEDAEDDPAAFDALGFVREAVDRFTAHPVDGVTSSSDYPGALVAAAVASELRLPGPDPTSVLRCSHKFYSRVAQREAVPEATPGFSLIDPQRLSEEEIPLRFPFFVKPVKSWFSVFARRVESFDELREFAAQPDLRAHLSAFVSPFNQLLQRYTTFEHGGGYLLAEELLEGEQVTVEGFSAGSEVTILGVVSSVMFPRTISFQRFDFPPSLDERVQQRMGDVAARAIRHLDLDNALFNVEMFYDARTDAIRIIEINPRMAGQFADLYEYVNGTNSYEILLGLAVGARPKSERGQGQYGAAASFPLRSFQDKRVRRVPSEQQIRDVLQNYPVSFVKPYYHEGERLSEGNQGDGYSYRYGMINMAGTDRATLLANFATIMERLGWELEDI